MGIITIIIMGILLDPVLQLQLLLQVLQA